MPIKSKSFTGCWTCRSRKIKCDLGTPECRQCLKANIKCEGYSIKLRWSGEADPGNDRRAVGFVKFPPNMLYDTYEELDSALNNLNVANPDADSTVVTGPFGLFAATPDNVQPRRRKRRGAGTPSGSATPVAPREGTPGTPHSTHSTQSSTPIEFGGQLGVMGALGGPPHMGHMGPIHSQPQSEPRSESPNDLLPKLASIEQELVEMFPEAYMDTGPTNNENLLFGAEGPAMLDFPTLPSDTFLLGNSPPMWAQARYLLQNYKEKVVPIMTYVVHAKNPWSTIYLPRAYNAIGDIVATGTTSPARYTLLHAVMACSAFYIRNTLPTGSPHREYYRELGEKLQIQAKSGLSQVLQTPGTKYKDFLVALLTMVTLDLVKGDSGLGVVPLNAAQRLINTRLHKRPVLSRKAKILHRICVMLTLLQRSTTFSPQELQLSDAWMDQSLEDHVPMRSVEELEKLESRQHPLSFMSDAAQLEQYFSEYSQGIPAEPEAIPVNYEAISPQLIHGVTESLMHIFKMVVEVSRKAFKARLSGAEFDHELTSACTRVEAHLEAWRAQFEQSPPTDLSVKDVNDVVRHHSLAFHNTLVVYHYRLAKDVNRMLLQPYLEKTIDHLEAIAAINAKGKVLALPFFFPGFICGCEILPDNVALAQRYDAWFDIMRNTCLSTYNTALQVLVECRRRRAANLGGDNWWDIVEEWGISGPQNGYAQGTNINLEEDTQSQIKNSFPNVDLKLANLQDAWAQSEQELLARRGDIESEALAAAQERHDVLLKQLLIAAEKRRDQLWHQLQSVWSKNWERSTKSKPQPKAPRVVQPESSSEPVAPIEQSAENVEVVGPEDEHVESGQRDELEGVAVDLDENSYTVPETNLEAPLVQTTELEEYQQQDLDADFESEWSDCQLLEEVDETVALSELRLLARSNDNKGGLNEIYEQDVSGNSDSELREGDENAELGELSEQDESEDDVGELNEIYEQEESEDSSFELDELEAPEQPEVQDEEPPLRRARRQAGQSEVRPSSPATKRKRADFTTQQKDHIRALICKTLGTRAPPAEEVEPVAHATGLTITQVRGWIYWFYRENPEPTLEQAMAWRTSLHRDILNEWFMAHLDDPYPSRKARQRLAHETGKTLEQIVEWFRRARQRNGLTSKRGFSPNQIATLCASFEDNSYPSVVEKQRLASATGLSAKQVLDWFSCERGRKGLKAQKELPADQKAPLIAWLHANMQNPFPSAIKMEELAQETGLTFVQVKGWFKASRMRIKRNQGKKEFEGRCPCCGAANV